MTLGVREHMLDHARADILSAAATCFMEHGYSETSIDDVAVKNNVTYTYFVVATLPNPEGAGTIQSGVSNYATLKL